MSNSLTYKEISKLLDLVESELFRVEDKQRKENSMTSISAMIKEKDSGEIIDWDVSDKKLESEISLLNAIKDKFTQLFERINFTFGVDNNRFNQPSQPKPEGN